MKWWLHHFPTWRHRKYCRLAAKMRIDHMELWEGCSIVIRNDDHLWFKTSIYIYPIYANIWGIWMVNVTIYIYIYIMIFWIYWPLMGHSDIGKDIKKSIPCFLSSPCEPDLAQNFTCPFCEPWDVGLKKWCLPLHWRPSTFLIFFGTLANLAASRRGKFGNNLSWKRKSWMLSWMWFIIWIRDSF